MLETAVVDVPSLDGGTEVWIEALPARTFHTPNYGEIQITPDKLQRMIKNFNDRVRGQDIAIDYDHGMDRAKGNQASGWMKELALRPSSGDPTLSSLFARVELTDDAAQEVKAKKYRYFSLEWDDGWLDNQGNTHSDVIMGGALTNRPVAKNIMPINMSEAMWDDLEYEDKKMLAVWATKFVNDLPDSAFLYVESGGTKDGDGKTVPRGKRHFPYKNPDGKIDLPHLRNAIARIPQAGTWLSESMKTSLQARARKLLGATSKAMGEDNLALLEAIHVMDEAGLEITDESKEWEHSEPGTGQPPSPRTDQDGSDDPAIREGWRRPTPPDQNAPPPQTSDNVNLGGGKLTPEQEFELRNILGINTEGDVIEAARLQLGELTELKRTVDAASQERKFAEEYPAFWGEHNKLMDRDRDNSARAFSESVHRVRKAEGFGLKETAKGLSSMALTKVKDLHMHFAEGKATLEEYEDVIRTIVNGGIVEFGEVGTSVDSENDLPLIDTSSAPGIAGARKLFGEVLAKIQRENPEMDFRTAFAEASRKHPDLAEAYAVALPG